MPTIQPAPRARRPWHGGPPPTYQPSFSAAEIAEAEAWACSQALPHGEVQRARLALLLHEQPDLRSPEAARRLGQSTSWVCKWRRRWVEEGFSLGDAARRGRPRQLLDWMRALVIAVACELPSQRGLALGRHCASSIWQVVTSEGVQISLRSLQRILKANALKPWQYASWMHPRDPNFVPKVKVILNLYQFIFEGRSLGPRDHVICADEKTSIQARRRRVTAPGPGQQGRPGKPGHIESDYERAGAVQYLAAWDVRLGIPFGRIELKTGIEPFMRLVDQIMAIDLYRTANRIFLIVDNGSSHQGKKAAERMHARYPNLILIHTPVHASWVNQIEIYFSILQRKVLSPAVAASLAELAARILDFEATMHDRPKTIDWQFTSIDFDHRLAEIADVGQLAA